MPSLRVTPSVPPREIFSSREFHNFASSPPMMPSSELPRRFTRKKGKKSGKGGVEGRFKLVGSVRNSKSKTKQRAPVDTGGERGDEEVGTSSALDVLEGVAGYGVYEGYPHKVPWRDILEDEMVEEGGEDDEEEDEEDEEEWIMETPIPPPPPSRKKTSTVASTTTTTRKKKKKKKKDAALTSASKKVAYIPKSVPKSSSSRTRGSGRSSSRSASSASSTIRIPLPVNPTSIRSYDPSDSYLKHITYHEARKLAEKPLREAERKAVRLEKRVRELESVLREVLGREKREKDNVVPRVIMGWINRTVWKGFNKWKKVVEGMVRGDGVAMYRGEVVKNTVKGIFRKVIRDAFDRLKGERSSTGGGGEKGRDEYERFRGNLTWTEVPPGLFIG